MNKKTDHKIIVEGSWISMLKHINAFDAEAYQKSFSSHNKQSSYINQIFKDYGLSVNGLNGNLILNPKYISIFLLTFGEGIHKNHDLEYEFHI